MLQHYRRHPLVSFPSGAFFYVLAFVGANYLQIGVGFESANGLQLSHHKTVDLHHEVAITELEKHITNQANTSLVTGKLSKFFDGSPTVTLNESQVEALMVMAREVRDEVWGDPLDWESRYIDLDDSRFVWLSYGSDIDKIRIGIGIKADDTRVHGDHAYAVGKSNFGEFAHQLWLDPSSLFMGKQVGWGDTLPFIAGEEKQMVSIELVRLADKVWKRQDSRKS